jgi:hypothetical protein
MTSPDYRRVGLIQFLLALTFVVWLVLMPGYAASFAWPVGSALSARFIGTCFALRSFEGFMMWREPRWSRLRWMSWGTMAFLIVIFAATYWHVDLINWRPFNLIAIIWVIAYTAEPLVIPFVEPRQAEAGNADVAAGAEISGGLRTFLMLVMFVAAVLFGMFFINPAKFVTNLWPWPVTPFDARVSAAFFAGIVFWAARMLGLRHWSEIRMGMQGLMLFFGGHALVWVFNLARAAYDPARMVSVWVYGLAAVCIAAGLAIFYFRQEILSRASLARRGEAAA